VIREICQGIYAITQERNETHMFPKIMAEILFRHFICDFVSSYKSQTPIPVQPAGKSKKDRRPVSPPPPASANALPRISEALVAIGSMHTISPSSPLSLLNEFVFIIKPTVAQFYSTMVVCAEPNTTSIRAIACAHNVGGLVILMMLVILVMLVVVCRSLLRLDCWVACRATRAEKHSANL
jgi:hypothetical protein